MIEENMLKNESGLSQYASKSIDSIRFENIKNDIRPSYFRDYDRIIYSQCYSRYIGKTQVFTFKNNDHITKRIIHVQLVSKIARTIGRALNLNEDLIEAISIGHDVGHVGEGILNEISINNLNQPFLHNVQSVRNLLYLENGGKGLNLSIQVYDGILCYNGEKILNTYTYKEKTKEEFLKEYNNCCKDSKYSKNLSPMTLEGCVVRISDVIAYLGKDIEDAIMLKILSKKDIPNHIKNMLGDNNKSIINYIIMDIIENSINKPYIKLSDDCFKIMNELLNFNYKNIYAKAYTSNEKENIKDMFNKLYKYYLDALNNKDVKNSIYKVYLIKMNKDYMTNNSNERIVIDYIAGMTDEYFINEYNSLYK
ncbi:MAG: HD domain-containing protein [Clostridium sp.]|nr:HD domain-containing protein [Clostridium sp.]MCM1444125.1 HD domain-containing protein [Candidatus Amulumruptor caecigallinarius]